MRISDWSSDVCSSDLKTDEMLKRTLEIGTWGTWWAMRAAFPHMKARGGGAIVNFYSIDAQTGAWLHSDYNMNKGALLGLQRSAAVEWGRFNIQIGRGSCRARVWQYV